MVVPDESDDATVREGLFVFPLCSFVVAQLVPFGVEVAAVLGSKVLDCRRIPEPDLVEGHLAAFVVYLPVGLVFERRSSPLAVRQDLVPLVREHPADEAHVQLVFVADPGTLLWIVIAGRPDDLPGVHHLHVNFVYVGVERDFPPPHLRDVGVEVNPEDLLVQLLFAP